MKTYDHQLVPSRQNKGILYVAENGSKAWGYDSPLSDQDVRYVYVKPLSEYVTAFTRTDNQGPIKHPTKDAEYVGWDVSKVLNMTRAGNAQVYELFASPVEYFNSDLGAELQSFCLMTLANRLPTMTMHYYGLAKKTYQERIRNVGEVVTAKKYLYIVRPILSAYQLMDGHFPELNLGNLIYQSKNRLLPGTEVHETVTYLLREKRAGSLDSTVRASRLEALDTWIEANLNYIEERAKEKLRTDNELPLTFYEDSDRLLYKIAKETWKDMV